MWPWLKSLFTKTDNSLLAQMARSPAYQQLRDDVQTILECPLDSSAEREAIDGRIMTVLETLGAEIGRIREQGKDAPGISGLSGDDWVAGIGCADQACALYEHFDGAGWTERAENASALWAQAVLAVCPHYHHMVGPAMIANARCHEALGNAVRADSMYRAVLGDFEQLVDEFEAFDALGNEDRAAIESLDTAIERLLALGALTDRSNLEALRTRTQSLLG